MTPYYDRAGITIYHGEALAVLRDLPAASVDGVVTDPPYSSGGQFRGDRAGQDTTDKYVQSGTWLSRPDFTGDNRDQRGYAYWSALWLSEALRVSKPGAPICVFTDWRQLPTTTDALQAGGWVWRGIVVWDKTEGARPLYGRFRPQCEYVVWGSNGPMPINDGRPCLPGVYRTAVRQADKHHIAGKPTDLMQHLVQIVPAGGVILDPFCGSGTTGVGAKAAGYRFVGVELSEGNCEITAKRLSQDVLPLFDQEVAS